jgi:enterochelin esterase family protein
MGYSQDIPLSQILVPSENWKKTTLSNLSALASDSQGALFLANSKTKSISKLDSNGKTTDVVMDVPAKALALDSLGGIYLASGSNILYAASGNTKASMIIEGLDCVALCTLNQGKCYGAAPTEKAIYLFDKSGAKKKVNTEDAVISLAVSNDETTLFAGSADGRSVFTFRIEQNGDITAKDRYVAPRKPPAGVTGSVPGMTLDKANRIYAATSLGVQVFDPTGRLCGVLLQPDFPSFASSIAFAGSDKSTLHALVGQNLYTRKILFPGK